MRTNGLLPMGIFVLLLGSSSSALTVRLTPEATKRRNEVRELGSRELTQETLAKLDAPLHDPADYIRRAATASLGRILKKATGVITAAGRPTVYLTASGTEPLDLTGPLAQLIKMTRDSDDGVRAAAAHALQELSLLLTLDQFEELVPLVWDPARETRRYAVQILSSGPKTVAIRRALERALLDEDLEVKHLALITLLPTRSTAAFVHLEYLVNQAQSDQMASMKLFNILSEVSRLGLQGARARDALINTLNNPNAPVAHNAALALSHVAPDDPRAAIALTKALENRHPGIRIAAARGLSVMGSAAAPSTSKLIEMARNDTVENRAAALLALGEIRKSSRGILAVCRSALKDENREIRIAGVKALCRLKWKGAIRYCAALGISDPENPLRAHPPGALDNLQIPAD